MPQSGFIFAKKIFISLGAPQRLCSERSQMWKIELRCFSNPNQTKVVVSID